MKTILTSSSLSQQFTVFVIAVKTPTCKQKIHTILILDWKQFWWFAYGWQEVIWWNASISCSRHKAV